MKFKYDLIKCYIFNRLCIEMVLIFKVSLFLGEKIIITLKLKLKLNTCLEGLVLYRVEAIFQGKDLTFKIFASRSI